MTHCNAGWLATVDHGTALAPVYAAREAGIAGAGLGLRNPARATRACSPPGNCAQPRRAAHLDRRQCGRHPAGARRGRCGDRRCRPHRRQRRRRQQDRHLPQGAGRARQRRPLLRRRAVLDHRLRLPGRQRASRSRNATATNCAYVHGLDARRPARRCRTCAADAHAVANPAFDVTPGARWSPASSPNAASAAPAAAGAHSIRSTHMTRSICAHATARHRPRHERRRPQPRHRRQPQRARWRRLPDHADRHALRRHAGRRHRADGDGRHRQHASARKPSSEWRFHRDLYAARPEAGAVLHAHSPFATSLACLRRDIPPFHYMIARFGGDTVRCADYATFGTQALSDAALEALEDRSRLPARQPRHAGLRPRPAQHAGPGHRIRVAVRALLARPASSASRYCCRTPKWKSYWRSSRATGSSRDCSHFVRSDSCSMSR